MHCRSDAEEYDGVGPFLLLKMKTSRHEKELKFKAVDTAKEIFVQTDKNKFDEEILEYNATLVDQSMQEHSGEITIPKENAAGFYLKFDKYEITDMDYVLHSDTNTQPLSWLLGTFAYSRTRRTRGIGSGKVLMIYDNQKKKETRTIEYNLLDEELIVEVHASNPTKEKYRLRIENSFLFAENFDLDTNNELVEICVLPTDIYRIELIIKPSGEAISTCRRL